MSTRFTLSDASKLTPAQQKEIMADLVRSQEARDRIMAQLANERRIYSPMNAQQYASPTPAEKTPARPTCAAAPWLPAAALHAIPAPNYRAPSGAKPQSPVLHAPVEPVQGETLYAGRVHVRITSYRRRLLDPDNLTAKWFLDACRYARLIRNDRPEDITYEVGQEKVARKEEERTEVVIEPL
jgi:hypothetical protein